MVLQYKMASTLGNDMRFKYHFLSLSISHKYSQYFRVWNCGKYRICVRHIFDKDFVKATFLVKSWFHEIFFQWESIFRFFALCMWNSTAGELQIFRELIWKLKKNLLKWNEKKIRVFPQCQAEKVNSWFINV